MYFEEFAFGLSGLPEPAVLLTLTESHRSKTQRIRDLVYPQAWIDTEHAYRMICARSPYILYLICTETYCCSCLASKISLF